MLSLHADLWSTYFKLSASGRRWARRLRRSEARHSDRPRLRLIDDPAERRELLAKLVFCDRTFREGVPRHLPEGFGRSRDEVYARWIPFSVINVLLRCRLLEAYGIAWDRNAELRLTVLVFLMREWNDVHERFGVEAAFDAARTDTEPEPPLFLNRRLYRWLQELAPLPAFPDLAPLARLWLERPPELARPLSTAASLEAVASNTLLFSLATMLPKVPESVRRSVRPFGRWLYGLDQLSDYHRDEAAGTPNYFAALSDPVSEVWKIVAACEDHLRREAPAPERLVALMRLLTELTVHSYENRWHIESDYFGAADVPS
jgi:hypothetical protein